MTRPPTVPGRDLNPGPLSYEASTLLTELTRPVLIDINTEDCLNKTKDKLNKTWKLGLSQKLKLRTYIKFKDIFKTEEYTK